MRIAQVVLLVAIAAPALGPAAIARADDAEESRFHDALGHEHYEARHFEAALREFFEAARLAPSPRITFNIALCFDLLHQEDDAYLFFREYTDTSDQDPERRRYATEAITRLEARVARVAVTSEPPGAVIYVDQRDHGSYGTTPRVLALPPGSHVITIEREGYRSVTVTVEAQRGEEVAATGTLERIVGSLHVDSTSGGAVSVREPGGATLHQGEAPFDVALPPGLYEVEVQAEGSRPFTSVARVAPETRTEIRVALEALPPPTGDLTIAASAAGALIEVDGEPAGFAPTLLTELSLGEHRVRLTHAGLAPYEGTVSIEAGARGWLTVTLEEPATVDRSPATWAVGGVGIATILAGVVSGALAVVNHDRFETRQDQLAHNPMAPASPTLAEIRSNGELLNTATDALLAVGAVCLVTAVVLYFVTEHTDVRESRATFSEGER